MEPRQPEGRSEDVRDPTESTRQEMDRQGPSTENTTPQEQTGHPPRIGTGQIETQGARAGDNVTPTEGGTESGALAEGSRDADISVVQAGILTRLVQAEKTILEHADMMAAWCSQEECQDSPQAGRPEGSRDADISVVQAGILTRLVQAEKTILEHADMMAAWCSQEECQDSPQAGRPEIATQNVHSATQAERMSIGALQGPVAVGGQPPQLVQVQPAVQASTTDTDTGKFWIGKLNYMKHVPLFHGSTCPSDQKPRSWQEWQGEFTQNARLCKLDESMYYDIAQALLSTPMREAWLTYLKVRPQDAIWAGMEAYMGAHYAALDKSVDAVKKLEETKLECATEKAWQTYSIAQAGHVADMGSATERKLTDAGIWDTFLQGINTVPDIHATAFQAYMASKEVYDALPVQARITKLTPVLLTYLKSSRKAVGKEKALVADSSRAEGGFAGGQKGYKRYAESLEDMYTERHKMQADSSTVYHTVPTDVDFQKCPDVGFQYEHEGKPYSHSLRMQLQAQGLCLVCWSNAHRIAECPHRS